ncbi:MAG TPA: hypothetical protein VK192_01410 [Sphingomicrobium sp.]|nr:hypothetical protein [Sphingomicrobium sp.]
MQDRGEQRARHSHLSQLEDEVAAAAHNPGVYLHELLAQGRERPWPHTKARVRRSSMTAPGMRSRSMRIERIMI